MGPESSLSFFGTAEAVPSRKAHERGRSRLHLLSLTPSTSFRAGSGGCPHMGIAGGGTRARLGSWRSAKDDVKLSDCVFVAAFALCALRFEVRGTVRGGGQECPPYTG